MSVDWVTVLRWAAVFVIGGSAVLTGAVRVVLTTHQRHRRMAAEGAALTYSVLTVALAYGQLDAPVWSLSIIATGCWLNLGLARTLAGARDGNGGGRY